MVVHRRLLGAGARPGDGRDGGAALLNFGVFTTDGTQVAYARVATDHATFGWLCDVYVHRDHRGRGLGTRLVQAVVARLRPLHLKRVHLSTLDAHAVYARVGFVPVPNPEMFLVLGESGE